MSAVPHVPSDWQAGFLNLLPSVRTHARIQFRKLPVERREEAIQETIAAACMHYQLATAQGKLHAVHPGPLADFAVRHVRTGRHVGSRQDRRKDVLSPVCRRRYGVQVQSYHQAMQSGCRTDGWRQLAIADRRIPVPDLAAFRLDFTQWLGQMTRRDRRIIAALVSGEGTGAVAGRFGLSPARVSQLRRSYEHRWQVFQGEVTVAARAS